MGKEKVLMQYYFDLFYVGVIICFLEDGVLDDICCVVKFVDGKKILNFDYFYDVEMKGKDYDVYFEVL